MTFNIKFKRGDHDFERDFGPAKNFFVEDPRGIPMAEPCERLPVGEEILLPEFFHEKLGRFEMWSPATLDQAGALAWSFWMTATWFVYHNEPALMPYIAQLRPRNGWRLGCVVRPGFGGA